LKNILKAKSNKNNPQWNAEHIGGAMQNQTNQLLYLSQAEVIDVGLTMAEIIESMEVMFRAKGEGRTEMPPKPGIHPGGGDSFLHAMPACIPDLKSAGIKWVSAFPGNPA